MATSELDTTPVEWKVVRENLVQLHCEDVSWEQATDKIPLDLVRYLLGDLVPHLSTLVFLRGTGVCSQLIGQRFLIPMLYGNTWWTTLFTRELQCKWLIIISLSCCHMLASSMKTWLIYIVKLHFGEPHPNFRKEDVWVQGSLQPMEHPEMLYLPPNLPGSTPKKANIAKPQSRSDLPSFGGNGTTGVSRIGQTIVGRKGQ